MKPDTPSRERAMGEVMVLVFQIHGMGRSGVGYHEVRAGTGPVAPKEKGTPHCHKRVALITDAPRRPPLSKLQVCVPQKRRKQRSEVSWRSGGDQHGRWQCIPGDGAGECPCGMLGRSSNTKFILAHAPHTACNRVCTLLVPG